MLSEPVSTNILCWKDVLRNMSIFTFIELWLQGRLPQESRSHQILLGGLQESFFGGQKEVPRYVIIHADNKKIGN